MTLNMERKKIIFLISLNKTNLNNKNIKQNIHGRNSTNLYLEEYRTYKGSVCIYKAETSCCNSYNCIT